MALRAGNLRHRVTIQQPGTTRDPNTGESIPGWVDVATVWASVEPLSAREFIAASATQSKVSARIVMRHRADVTAGMRITHRGRLYNIEGDLPDNESGLEWLTLPVSEGVSDGG